MKGIQVINDPSGNPAVLTIDLHNLDPDAGPPNARPLVAGLLEHIEQAAEDTERAEWLALSAANLERVYGDDEPDYSDVPAYTRNRL